MLIIYTLSNEELKSRDDTLEELISRLAEGDGDAMGELYGAVSSDIFAYALSKTAKKELSEDITHDTFVQIYKYASQYTPMGKPMAWIITIELNLIRRHINKSQRFVQLDDSMDIPENEKSISDTVINNEFLRELMMTLGEDEREIISLHVVSGMKHREIAKILEKPLSTVLSKYNRAIKKLQLQVRKKEEN